MTTRTTSQKVRVLFAVAGIGVAIWLLIEIAMSAVHGAEGVAGIRVPPASVSEGEAWGIYGLYAALVLGSALPLDKTETVRVPADWLLTFLVLVALTLGPGAFLLVPDNVSVATFPPTTLTCGSWMYPSFETIVFRTGTCASSLESRFRWAAAIAAAGLIGPYLVMAYSLQARKRVRAAKAAGGGGSGSEGGGTQADA